MFPAARLDLAGIAIVSWGVLGIVALIGEALYRLTPIAFEALEQGMRGWQWAICAGWVIFNGYAEGYRGFQLSFSPRVVARAMYLARHPRPLHVALAPAFCMALFHAKRRNLVVSWCLLLGIVVLVVFVRLLPQPWRGIIDGGVVVGLVWGTASLLFFYVRAIAWGAVPADDSLPDNS